MKQTILLKSLLLAAVLAPGLARADDNAIPAPKPAQPVVSADDFSLLGQANATVTYSRINLADTSVAADSYGFETSQPLAFGLDGVLAYDYTKSGVFAGARVNQQVVSAALRAFSASYNWGKPYVEAGIGHAWSRYAGATDRTGLWFVTLGAELRASERAVVTPYVQYADTPNFDAGDATWNYGVRASYRLDRHWALTAGIERDNSRNTAYSLGTNFRF